MRVILARHGDAVGTHNKFHGMMDTPLTAKGRKDVESLAEELRQYHPVAIIASPLSRTLESARTIGKILNIPVTTNKALLPLDLGDYVGKPVEKYREAVRWFLGHPNEKIPNGGTVNEWASRFIPFFNKQVYDDKSGQTVIDMTHGRNIILAKADMKLGNNPRYDTKELVNADKSTEHAGYAIAQGNPASFQIMTPHNVPAGQS